MADLISLNRSRGTLKRKLTGIQIFLSARTFKKGSEEKLNTKKEEADEIYLKFQEVQTQIEEFLDSTNENQLLDKASEFESQYQTVMNSFEEILSRLTLEDTVPATPIQKVPSNPMIQSTSLKSNSKLDKIGSDSSDSEIEVAEKTMIQADIHPNPNQRFFSRKNMFQQEEEITTETILKPKEKPRNVFDDTSEQPIRTRRVKPKLPEFKLPQFSGKVEEWISFRDSFSSLIHSDPEMDNIDKFNYLLSCLSESVKEEIGGIQLSSDNYPIAWQTLKGRYDDEKLLFQTHLDKLFACPSASSESHTELRRILNCFRVNLAQITASCPSSVYWDAIIVYMVKQRIDSKTRRALEMSTENSVSMSWKQLQTFLEKRCRYLETLPIESSNTNPPNQKPSKTASKPETKIALMAVKSNKFQCNVCHQDHLTYSCPQIKDVPIAECIEKLKSLRLCFNCLLPNHTRQNCRNLKRCHVCHENHNTVIHKYFEGNFEQEATSDPPKTEVKSNEKPDEKPNENQNKEKTTTSCCAFAGANEQHIFLSTAVVMVENHLGVVQPCRVLLDNGSQSNFITERFANSLKLKQDPANIKVTGLNQEPIHIRNSIRTKVNSRVKDYEKEMNFLIVPSIADSIPHRKIHMPKIDFPEEKLADPHFSNPAQVDMLIGAEHFLELLQDGKMSVGETEMYFKNSVFGWIAAGKIEYNSPSQALLTVHCFMNQRVSQFPKKPITDQRSCHEVYIHKAKKQKSQTNVLSTANSSKVPERNFKCKSKWKPSNQVACLSHDKSRASCQPRLPNPESSQQIQNPRTTSKGFMNRTRLKFSRYQSKEVIESKLFKAASMFDVPPN